MTRANARELAVHLIYGRIFTGEEPEEVIAIRLDKDYYGKLSEYNKIYSERPDPVQRAYIDTVVSGVANRADELNEHIQKYSIGWDVSRISKLTRCVMQLAIYEILHMEDVPTGVAISEAVRLAKKYDAPETGSFVNGILGSFLREEVKAKGWYTCEEDVLSYALFPKVAPKFFEYRAAHQLMVNTDKIEMCDMTF